MIDLNKYSPASLSAEEKKAAERNLAYEIMALEKQCRDAIIAHVTSAGGKIPIARYPRLQENKKWLIKKMSGLGWNVRETKEEKWSFLGLVKTTTEYVVLEAP